MNFNPIIYNNLSLQYDYQQDNTILNTYKNDEYTYCTFCGLNIKKYLVLTYIHDEQIETLSCKLCNSIINFNNSYMNYLILCSSSLTQTEIVKQTFNYFLEHKKIPNPNILDPDIQYINKTVYAYSKNKLKKNKYKVFFTNEALFLLNNRIQHEYDISYIN